MPPKKAAAAKAVNKKQNGEEDTKMSDQTKEEEVKVTDGDEEMADASSTGDEQVQAGQKRKSPPTPAAKEKPPKKEARQGSRSSSRTAGGGAGKDVDSRLVLNFLLSKDALQYCYPEDELNAARSGDFKKCYSLTPPSLFTPFEHLITAALLSKPLSHTLGMRSVRTLLNKPYEFNTPGQMRAAGEDKIWQALEDARTQHRQKTASFLYQMAEQYADPSKKDDKGDKGDSDEMLELAIAANEGGAQATFDYVKSTIKGMGETGASIFCRRVQACEGWGEALWPYADSRAFDALRELGVKVGSADELQAMIERDVDFDKLGDMGLLNEKKGVDDKDYEVQVAVEFVTALERAVGCSLEGKTTELRKAAAAWT